MLNRTPIPRDQRPPLPDFEPVPRRRNRHDGWTPERQRAFIEALADTGSVSRAAHMVNMSPESAYQLRRQPGAEGFRRAWDAALDFGLARLKDQAFDRALNGYLVPVFTGGTLRGFRRKKNDRLLMFCLRHYGHDAEGRRVTINYFNARASAAVSSSPAFAGEGDRAQRGGGASCGGATSGAATAIATAEATTTTHTLAAPTRAARDDASAALINHFEPAILDDQAQAEIQAVLAACAERRRTLDPVDDPDTVFVAANEAPPFAGAFESGAESEDLIPYRDGELSWEGMGEGGANAGIEAALAGIEARKREPPKVRARRAAEEKARLEAEARAQAEQEAARQKALSDPRLADPNFDPLDWRNYEK